jgi:hypothetical protein
MTAPPEPGVEIAAARSTTRQKRDDARCETTQNAVHPSNPEGDPTMRFMMIVKASEESEAGAMPTERELADMTRFNEELAEAGALVAGEGLHPSSTGARVTFAGGTPTVTDGPFAETKELIAGFWIIEAGSREEALAWAKKVPFVDGEIEVRQVFDAADFGEAFTPELQQREEQLRAQIAAEHG